MNTAMTRIYVYFAIIFTVVGRCQIFILKKTDLIRFVKINPRHPDRLKKQIWVEKPSNGSPNGNTDAIAEHRKIGSHEPAFGQQSRFTAWCVSWFHLSFRYTSPLYQSESVIYYVYMVSFSLSRYHLWITSGLVLNVIC